MPLNLFIGLVLALLATLSFHDPVGRYMVGDREIKVGTFSQHLGYVFKGDPAIYINMPYVLAGIIKSGGEREKIIDAYAIGACALVHEATHKRLPDDADHELPDLYQYVCLDRLGASRESKQRVYDAINKTAREKYGE